MIELGDNQNFQNMVYNIVNLLNDIFWIFRKTEPHNLSIYVARFFCCVFFFYKNLKKCIFFGFKSFTFNRR